jgi:hypothetical protein
MRFHLLARLRRLAAFPAICVFAIAALVIPRPATAQISRVGGTLMLAQIFVRGTDVAFNPASQTILMVGAAGQALTGICSNASGSPITPLFSISEGIATGTYLHFPRVTAGPGGAFLVSWHQGTATPNNGVFVRIVSCAAPYNLTAPALASDFTHFGSFVESGPAVAYSPTSGRFLVVWKTAQSSLHGRFVDQNGSPIGGVFWLTNVGGSRDPGVTWNAATNEFGVSYTGWDGGGAFAAFVRVNAAGDGSPVGRTTFAYSGGTYNTDISYNAATGHYVMGWVGGGAANYATFSAGGSLMGIGLLASEFGGTDNLSLAFGPASGTFLAVGQDNFTYDVAGRELNSFGVPISAAAALTDGGGPGLIPGGHAPGSFYPRVTGLSSPRWAVGYARQFGFFASQIVATTSVAGGPQTPPGGAPAPAPAPAPTPPPSGGGCVGSAPFPGAVCENGGWVPGSSCVGSAPFPGAVCVNGGWVPGGTPSPAPTPAPPAPAPAPPTGSCVGSAPFPGAICVNGGWVPGSTCVGSAPFPGAVCVNGGWVPGEVAGQAPAPSLPTPAPTPAPSACAGNPPGPGWVCLPSGGWVPPDSPAIPCAGLPDPFVGIPGLVGVCINNGWVPVPSGGGRP